MNRLLPTIGWGLYLSNSWTWCIGMFLPVIMLRLFGVWGFIAFAIPNIVGCTLFGYVLNKESSKRFVERHAGALRTFGLVTIAFQCYFAGWAFTNSAMSQWLVLGLTAAALGIAPFVGGSRRDLLFGSTAVAVTSLFLYGVIGGPALLTGLPAGGRLEPGSVLWLLPCLILGFAASPYLDLTFHRALQESPSRHSFLVFGAVFSIMLAFAACSFLDGAALPIWPVAAQWGMQLAFTVTAHLRELRQDPPAPERRGAGEPADRCAAWVGWTSWKSAATIGAVALGLGAASATWLTGHPTEVPVPETSFFSGESNYLRFLAYYGWIVPCWLLGSSRGWPTWLRLAVIALGLPLLELAWIEFRLPLATIAAGVLLVLWALPLGNVLRPATPAPDTGARGT